MKRNVFGIDIAKLVFQIHWVDTETGEMYSEQLKRVGFLQWFSNKPSSQIGIEACSGTHHWARQLIGMGHEVKLLPAHQVKPFVVSNKNDVADARGWWHRPIKRPEPCGPYWLMAGIIKANGFMLKWGIHFLLNEQEDVR